MPGIRIAETAKQLGVSTSTLQLWRKKKIGPNWRLNDKGVVWYSDSSVKEWKEKRKTMDDPFLVEEERERAYKEQYPNPPPPKRVFSTGRPLAPPNFIGSSTQPGEVMTPHPVTGRLGVWNRPEPPRPAHLPSDAEWNSACRCWETSMGDFDEQGRRC